MSTAFRLQSVLRWRELQRDECRQAWAEACRDEENLRQRAEQLWEEIVSQQARRRQALDTGTVQLDAIQARHCYELTLRHELESLHHASALAAQRRESQRQAWQEADQAVEALERLRERAAESLAVSERRQEQRETDDSAARRWERRAG
ncbi:MAG: flagellar export protein FliJ [Pirellulales bacterium]